MITFANFLGANARPTYERLAAYVADRIGQPTEFLSGVEWEEQHRMLDEGRVQVAFICGLPYSQKHDRGLPVELIAAPIMLAERYRGQPIYFTDAIVRSDSPYRAFADLRGKVRAYNGNDSNSGYNMPRDHLLRLGETSGYFGRTVASGAHQKSIQMVLDGSVDASGVDSLVLDMEFKLRPELKSQLRLIESIGPYPIPPVVASSLLADETKRRLREIFLAMHEDAEGKTILADGLTARFVQVDDAYYNPIRDMARRAEAAGFFELG